MFGADMKSIHVIEPAVCRFCHHRAGPSLKDRALLHLPVDDRITHNTHGMSVGDSNWTLQKTAFLDPGRPRHLAVAIERKISRVDRVMLAFAAWMDDRQAGADVFSFDDRCVTDLHAVHIGNGVEWAGPAFEWNSEIPCARFGHGISPYFELMQFYPISSFSAAKSVSDYDE